MYFQITNTTQALRTIRAQYISFSCPPSLLQEASGLLQDRRGVMAAMAETVCRERRAVRGNQENQAYGVHPGSQADQEKMAGLASQEE